MNRGYTEVVGQTPTPEPVGNRLYSGLIPRILASVTNKTTRVYIVEDSPAFASAIADLVLEVEGVELVGSAGDAERAKEEIGRLRPDVAILDIRIKGGTGIDVLRSVRSKEQFSTVVIMFSSNMEPGYRRRCLQLGADYVFDKSHEYNRVVEVLREISRA